MGEARDRLSGGVRQRYLAPHVWLCVAAMLAAQLIAFCATRPLLAFLTIRDYSLPLDAAIPFVPEWVIVYCLAYISWAASGVIILAQDKPHCYRMAAAYILSMLVAGIIFLAWPGTLDRPEIAGTGLCRDLLRWIYRVDNPAYNLCPSLHVMVSYFCWRGLLSCRRIPAWFKAFNLAFLVLVCLSVVYVKQHVLIDIPAAVLVGEGSLQAARLWKLERIPYAVERRFAARRSGK